MVKERLLSITVALTFALPPLILFAVESLDVLKPLQILTASILQDYLAIQVGTFGMISIRVVLSALLLIVAIENTRIVPYLFHFFVFTNMLWLSNISLANLIFKQNINNYEGLRHLHSCYMRLTLLQHYVRTFADIEAFFLFKVVSKICPFLLFLCIRMYNIFPIEIYVPVFLGLPIALVICILITRFTSDINEESKTHIQI